MVSQRCNPDPQQRPAPQSIVLGGPCDRAFIEPVTRAVFPKARLVLRELPPISVCSLMPPRRSRTEPSRKEQVGIPCSI